ncbi:DNA methyltransferase [Neisseria subflava]|uniref:DNA methyltransferase n=1 Tax=Neisseria subflava TaxID=28449 RepID=UPI003305CF74
MGNRIAFAYQTFPWANNAKDKAAVHVVIIGLEATHLSDGLSPNSAQPKLYKLLDKEWHSQSVANISPYLIAGSNLAVAAREQPLGMFQKLFGVISRLKAATSS